MPSPRPARLHGDELESRDAPAGLSYTAPFGNGADRIVLRLNDDRTRILVLDNGSQVDSRKLNNTTSITITGAANEDDTLVVDYSFGFFAVPITYNGGVGGADALEVIGTGATGATYNPSGTTPGSGTVTVGAATIQFSSLSPVLVSQMSALTLTTPNSADSLTVDSPTASRTRVSGSSGGVAIEALTFFNVGQATIDTGTNDGASANDTVAVSAGALVATGLSKLTVTTGAGNDTLSLNTLGYALPVGGGFFTFNAGTGTGDKIVAIADANLTLQTTLLQSSGGGQVNLVEVETASLTGGGGANTLDVSGFSGPATLSGGLGNDLLIGGLGDNRMDGGAGDDVYLPGIGGSDQLTDTGAGADTYVLVPGQFLSFSDDGGNNALDFSGSPQSITADIHDTYTFVTYSGGGTVNFPSSVAKVTGTSGGDTFIDHTLIPMLTLVGGPDGDPGPGVDDGDDIYVLDPGSTIGITDAGGTDRIDFSQEGTPQAITAIIGTDDTTVTDDNGLVTFAGTVEGVTATSEDDTLIDHTITTFLALDGGLGDDEYILNPGSTIGITDAGGTDRIDFSQEGSATQAITATVGSDESTVTDADGLVTFAGTLEAVVGTSEDDEFRDETIHNITLDGGLGDDEYILNPGSTIGITDAGGTDRIDFSQEGSATQAITATMGTDYSEVTDADGLVTIEGTAEIVIGTSRADMFVDQGDVDFVFDGRDGNDTYDLQPGSNITVIEGAGNDTVLLNRANYAVNANLATGHIEDTQHNTVNITNGVIENLVGSKFDDTIEGTPGDDVLNGGDGNDIYVIVPGGSDIITDTGGTDALDFSKSAWGVNIDLSRTNGSFQNYDTHGSRLSVTGVIEIAIGSLYDDVLTGSSGNDFLAGLAGNDRLLGQSGDDILVGGLGDDEANGGSGRDILIGGAGADRLNSASSEDILVAGFTIYDTVYVLNPSPPPSQVLVDQVNLAALSAIRDVWAGPGSPAQRRNAIRAGIPVNGTTVKLVAGVTVENNDGAVDVLTGGQAADWFFILDTPGGDVITDKDDSEFIN